MQRTKIPISLCGDSGPLPPQQGNPSLQKHFGPSSVSVTHTHQLHEIHINPIAITPTQMNVDGESGFQGNRNVASTSGDNYPANPYAYGSASTRQLRAAGGAHRGYPPAYQPYAHSLDSPTKGKLMQEQAELRAALKSSEDQLRI